MSDTMHAALDAALRFHKSDEDVSLDDVIRTAKDFYREIAVAAPNGTDPYSEDWYNQVHTWLRVLNGDQLGCVSTAVQRISAERNPPTYQPVPMPMPMTQVPRFRSPQALASWTLLDQLNGPQPYPGATVPVGPLVTHDELARELAKLGGDPCNEGDVRKAAESADAPIAPPALAPGDTLRIRPTDADPFTTATVTAELVHSPTEGFMVYVPPGSFSEAAKDQIEGSSATKLRDLLIPFAQNVRQGTTLLDLAKQVTERLYGVTGQLRERDAKIGEHEGQLREILGAADAAEVGFEYYESETTLDAARRVVKELETSEERVRELVWQLSEEQVRGKVREFGFGTESEPPATVAVVRLICPPAQKETSGGFMLRSGEGWVRVQHKPESPQPVVGKPWNTALPSTESRARELTRAEMADWEAGR